MGYLPLAVIWRHCVHLSQMKIFYNLLNSIKYLVLYNALKWVTTVWWQMNNTCVNPPSSLLCQVVRLRQEKTLSDRWHIKAAEISEIIVFSKAAQLLGAINTWSLWMLYRLIYPQSWQRTFSCVELFVLECFGYPDTYMKSQPWNLQVPCHMQLDKNRVEISAQLTSAEISLLSILQLSTVHSFLLVLCWCWRFPDNALKWFKLINQQKINTEGKPKQNRS